MFTFIRAILVFLKSILLSPGLQNDPDSHNDGTPTPVELEKELIKKQLKLIFNEDAMQVVHKAMSFLSSLTEQINLTESVPKAFKCPLSEEIMSDPVMLANGETYDRSSIEELFRQGCKTCPKTKQDLTNSPLTPNNALKEMITQWQNERAIDPSKPEAATIRDCLNLLLDKMSSSLSDQQISAMILRHLTKQYHLILDLFSNEDISKLLKPLVVQAASPHTDLQLNIITTIHNISQRKRNKEVVAENPLVIPSLIHALRSVISETKTNAAAALFKLSVLHSNRILIRQSNALKHLIYLVEEGDPKAMRDVCLAIYMLCWRATTTYREKAIGDGTVRKLWIKVTYGAFLDSLLPVLETFSKLPIAIEEMGRMGAVTCLLKIMRESDNKDSNTVQSSAAILFDICSYDRDKLKEVKQEEAAYGTISSVQASGTERARSKATEILEMGKTFG